MAIARNTHRFALLLVGHGIACGIDGLGADSAEGPALIGIGLGGRAALWDAREPRPGTGGPS
ncbi:MAG: hypothetical protein V5A62_09080 [Haloarculaceae archaeon]